MRNLSILIVFAAFLFFTFTQLSHSRCFGSGPDMFVCDSTQPNPDPDGIQQFGNANDINVDVFPGGNIDTLNFAAINLGQGSNTININGARIKGAGRAVNNSGVNTPDNAIIRNSELIGELQTLNLSIGDDFLDISDSTVTSTVQGFTVSLSDGQDTLIMERCTVSGGPMNSANVVNAGLGDDDFTIRNSNISSSFAGDTTEGSISMDDGEDKLLLHDSTVTIAGDVYPITLQEGDDEMTLTGNGSTIPGGIDCGDGNDTIIFSLEVPAQNIAPITEEINNLPTPNGGISINGFFYQYANCENLVADLRAPEGLPIPTLSEWGLIAMAGVLGIIGLLAVRRKKAAA